VSYCRWAWDGSDVYVFESERGLECCGCHLKPTGDFVAEDNEDMIVHLAEHRRAGQYVPYHAIERLWSEIPGAQRPVTGEPPLMTHARLIDAKVRLERAIDAARELAAKTKEP
jgi:hypothetical protein